MQSGPAAAPGPRRHLKAGAVAKEPYLIWNAFIDLIAMEEYESFTTVQRPAHLAFHYDAEVMNGGHHQYFENSAGQRSHETVDALLQLGLKCQADLLRAAIMIWDSKDRQSAGTSEKFLEGALEREFESHDELYEECSPTIDERLALYLKEHQSDFVIVEGAA
jgi:Domain of unknown function (DUF4375)